MGTSLLMLVLVRHAVLGALPPYQPIYVDNPLRDAGFWTARLTAIKVVGLDLRQLLFPLWLSSDWTFDQIPLAHASDPWAWFSVAAVLAILIVVFLRYRRDRLLFWCAGFFGIALSPDVQSAAPHRLHHGGAFFSTCRRRPLR